MKRYAGSVFASLIALGLATTTQAREAQRSDPDITARIVDEGLNRSNVMADAAWLSDRIGARLTNSPGMRRAEAWALARFRALGLAGVRRQGFAFGRGWSFRSIHVDMIAPRPLQLHAVPLPWTPGTAGPVTAEVVYAPMKVDVDLARWRGKLAGKWVMVDEPAPGGPAARGRPLRLSADDLAGLQDYPAPPQRGARPAWLVDYAKQAMLDAFLKREGAAGMVRGSYAPGQLVHGFGYQQVDGAALPGVELGAEDYGRLVRLAGAGGATIRVDSQAHFDDSDHNAYNILWGQAELRLASTLRLTLGPNAALYGYDVRSDLPANSGNGRDALVAPKASLAWRIGPAVELYADYGESYHSNDARGAATTIDPANGLAATRVPLLVRARGEEVGARVETGAVTATLVAFYLTLGSELVFVGDAGTTEPNAASRRYGTEATLFWRPTPALVVDLQRQ